MLDTADIVRDGDLSTIRLLDLRTIPSKVYNLAVSLPLRLTIMFTPLLVWGALYLVSRLGGIAPTRLTPWLRASFLVLIGLSLILFVFDRTRLSDIVGIHAWGLFGADMWIRRRCKQYDTEPLVTSLKL
jgi:hypothetical protein